MDFIELSSQVVLQSYGQFLDGHALRLRSSLEKFCHPWELNQHFIHLQVLNDDHSSFSDLLNTDNKEDVYITQLFITLIKEVNNLKQDLLKEFLPNLKYCGEVYIPQAATEGNHILVRHILPLYFDILSFVKRCRTVLIHIFEQLVRLFSIRLPKEENRNNKDASFISLQAVYLTIGDVLLLLISVDSLIACYHKDMESYWNVLKQNVLAASYENNLNQHELNHLLKVMGEVQSELLTGLVFQNTINIILNEKDRFSILKTQLSFFLSCQSKEFEYVDDSNCQAMDNCAKIIATFVLGSQLFELKDKKVNKFVTGFAKKFLATALFGQVFWSPSEFIVRNLESFSNDLRLSQLESNLPSYAEEFSKILMVKLRDFTIKVYHWCLKMENCAAVQTKTVKLNDMDVVNLSVEGLQLCNDIKYSINSASRLYYSIQKPIPKSTALCFCKLLELLKSVHSVFIRHELLISKTSNHAIQKVALRILNKIVTSKKVIVKELSSKKNNFKQIVSTLTLAERIFYGACSEDRILLINLLPAFPSNFVDLEYTYALIKYYCTQIDTVCNLRSFLLESSSTLFGVGESNLLPIYLKYLREIQSDYSRAKYVLDPSIWDERWVEDDSTNSALVKEGGELLNCELFYPLCQEFETRLRLLAHSHLNNETSSPIIAKDFRKFFRIEPIILGPSFFSTKHQIEKYLEKTFHDLLTVSLHDWHTYREMRSLAEYKFNLDTTEDSLPCQALSQGLDVLEVMRNIHIFVSKYLYNMNDQSFVELNSNNKHLNTITIHLIASSIWTHGTGIMNTTTNFIYQYLRKKILAFSQFLFDDNIKSRLMKDFNYLNENNQMKAYTFERAEKFIKSLNRLGLNEEGVSCIDQYRVLVTQIGNALGYVRLVRSGGQHHCLEASSFLPKFLPVSFNCSKMSQPTIDTVTCFQEVLANILHNLCRGTEYLKLLVEVFAQVFRSSNSLHTDLFVIIVPPLTLNFVQHMVTAKERINKKSKQGGKFTDDGFAMGIAYLLCMLNLTSEFESLHWFEMVYKKYKDEEEQHLKSVPNHSDSDKYENTRQLSLKHLQMHRQEFELLQYNIKSAQIIFQGK